MRARPAFLLGAAALIGLPAIAQQAAQAPQPAPATNTTAPATAPSQSPAPVDPGGPSESGVEVVSADAVRQPPPAVEYPSWAHRDIWEVGLLDPEARGLGAQPWGDASGAYLSTLMRRMETPIGSRWAQIALRNALIARTRAPRDVHPVDWAAERAWLLLRLGEADAARMLVAAVDTDRFTPKMTQVAVQAALADDPAQITDPRAAGFRAFADRTRSDRKALAACLAGVAETFSPKQLAGVSAPVLVAVGSDDETAGSGERLAALLPDARHHVIEGRDHMRAVGDRSHIAAAIDFLRGAAPGVRPAVS